MRNRKLLLELLESNYNILETLLSIQSKVGKLFLIEDGNLMVALIAANVELKNLLILENVETWKGFHCALIVSMYNCDRPLIY